MLKILTSSTVEKIYYEVILNRIKFKKKLSRFLGAVVLVMGLYGSEHG